MHTKIQMKILKFWTQLKVYEQVTILGSILIFGATYLFTPGEKTDSPKGNTIFQTMQYAGDGA